MTAPTAAEAARSRFVAIRRLLLVYLYVALLGPGFYLSSQGVSKIYLDWLVLLLAVAASRPYWSTLGWARAGLGAYGAYVAWLVAASFLNPHTVLYAGAASAVGFIFGVARPALIFLAFASLIRGGVSPAERIELARTVWRHLLFLTGLFGVLALLQVFGPRAVHGFFMSLWPRRDERVLPDAPEGATWASVTFDGFYHVFGIFMAMVATFCLATATSSEQRQHRLLALFGFYVAAATTIVTQSRAAVVALMVGLAGLMFLGDGRARRRLLLAGAVPLVLVLVALAAGMVPGREGSFDPAYTFRKLGTVLTVEGLAGGGADTSSEVGRVLYWQIHIKHFLDHPILGAGAYPAVSDSLYLVLLGQSGLVGAGLFLTAIILLARGLGRLRRGAEPLARIVGPATLAMLAAGMVGAYGVNVMSGERLGQAFYFTAAVWLGAFHRELGATEPPPGAAPAPTPPA